MHYHAPTIDMHSHGHHASDELLCNRLGQFTITDTDAFAALNALHRVAENRPMPSAGGDHAKIGAIGTHRPVQGALNFCGNGVRDGNWDFDGRIGGGVGED